ncbi:hypothetical protein SEEMEL47_00887, partial [Salmonella enterica subsp. enterica serovar Meleagridis]
ENIEYIISKPIFVRYYAVNHNYSVNLTNRLTN